jgi:hypothetical protein
LFSTTDASCVVTSYDLEAAAGGALNNAAITPFDMEVPATARFDVLNDAALTVTIRIVAY